MASVGGAVPLQEHGGVEHSPPHLAVALLLRESQRLQQPHRAKMPAAMTRFLFLDLTFQMPPFRYRA